MNNPLSLIMTLIVSALLTALLWGLWEKREKKDLVIGPKELGATNTSLRLFYGLVPVILGIHAAVPLLVNGVQGHLFASHHPMEGTLSNWVGLLEIMIALSLFYGGLARLAAILIGFLWILGIYLLGLWPMLESIQYLGLASFFYLAGRGPYAIDRILFPKLEPNVNYTDYALLLLRIGVGLNLIVWGWMDRLDNIPKVLEVLAGILIVLGIFPRTVSIITLICINVSLVSSNWHELIDYLPLYAALAVLLVWEPNNANQKLLWVEGLRKHMPD